MGVKKLFDFLRPESKKLKKQKIRIVEKIVKKNRPIQQGKTAEKAHVHQLLELIEKQLQAPKMATKAALIIEQMINNKK